MEDFVFSLSSGFLAHEGLNELTLKHKQTLKDYGISVLLLPSNFLEESAKVIVKRQLSRGFNLKEDRERTKFNQRYLMYKELGDIRIFSQKKPEIIAEQIKKEITIYNKKCI